MGWSVRYMFCPYCIVEVRLTFLFVLQSSSLPVLVVTPTFSPLYLPVALIVQNVEARHTAHAPLKPICDWIEIELEEL